VKKYFGCIKIVLVLSVSACTLPVYTTRHGVNVYHKTTTLTPSQEEVESAIDYITNNLEHTEDIEGVNLHLYNELFYLFRTNGEAVVADGYTDVRLENVLIGVVRTCFVDSGLVHELAHVIRGGDPFHLDKKFWDNVKKVEKQIIKDLCPVGYIHIETPTNHEPGQILRRK